MKLTRRQLAELVGDLHVYGGGVLASVGVGWWAGPHVGVSLFGVYVAWIGLSVRGGKKRDS